MLSVLILQTWTRLIRFTAFEKEGEHYGEPLDRELDIGLALSQQPGKTVHARVWSMVNRWDEGASFTGEDLTVEDPLPPVPVTTCVRAIGLNYKDHAVSVASSFVSRSPAQWPHSAILSVE